MKKLLLTLSILILSVSLYSQEMKVNRDMNLLNNTIFGVDTLRSANIELNGKNLDSLLSTYNIGNAIEADTLILGDTTQAGIITIYDGDSSSIKLSADTTGTLLVNEKPITYKSVADSLAEDIAALAAFTPWGVDSLTIELTTDDPPRLRIKPSYIAQYELVSANNVKLALKAPLASPTFTGTVNIPSPFMLGGVMMQTNATRLNYLKTATGTTGSVGSNVVFSSGPTFTDNVILPSTTTIGSVSSTELGYLNNVTSAIQPQFNGKLYADFAGNYTYVEEGFTGDEYVPLILGGFNVTTEIKNLPVSLPQKAVHDSLANSINELKTVYVNGSAPEAGDTLFILRARVQITIDSVFALIRGASASINFNLYFGTDITAGTKVFDDVQTADDVTVGETFSTGFSDTIIPIHNMLWLTIPTISNIPLEALICIYYH